MGPRSLGGLNKMPWASHASNYRAQWFIRYLDPSESGWKKIVDGFLLFNSAGERIHASRGVVIGRLTDYEKSKLLRSLPKKAKYLRECLREFWKLNLVPATENWERVGSEPIWYSHRIVVKVKPHVRKYLREQLDLEVFGDLMNTDTNRIFTRSEWKRFIVKAEYDREGSMPNNRTVFTALGWVPALVEFWDPDRNVRKGSKTLS